MLRPVLPEEVIEYDIHLPTAADPEQQCGAMRDWVATCCPFLSTFVWHREAFELRVEEGRVRGSVAFGDNISDEWFVVFLLVEISRAFPEAVVEMRDGDGQLLLIEAAMELPEWIDPDTSDHRVFVFRGELQLIGLPEEIEPERPFAPLHVTRNSGVHIVRTYGPQKLTRASDAVQACIERRLCEMPQKALIENHHYCLLVLPRALAAVLQLRPSVVARAVEAFYYRDEEEEKCLKDDRKARFGCATGVRVRVRLTRLLYVQLLQQTFPAPSARFKLPPESDPARKAAELGMKMTCGFELMWRTDGGKELLESLLQEAELRDGGVVVREATEKDTDSDASWMFVSPSDVDDLMTPLEAEAEQVKQMMDHAKSLRNFMEAESGMEGVDIQEDNDDKEELFDVQKFLHAMQRGLGLPEAEIEDEEAASVQEMMDEELSGYGRDQDYGEDLDLNLVEAIIKSHDASMGAAGPMSNLLQHLQSTKSPRK